MEIRLSYSSKRCLALVSTTNYIKNNPRDRRDDRYYPVTHHYLFPSPAKRLEVVVERSNQKNATLVEIFIDIDLNEY